MFLKTIQSLFTQKMGVLLKSQDQIEGIRESCQLAAATLDHIAPHMVAGVSTSQINNLIQKFMEKHGATPATLGYKGYPAASCISVNEVVCHGIPSEKTILQEGDIVNVDVTTILNKFFGDTSRMFLIGKVSDEAKQLVEDTKTCLDLGIRQCKPGNYLGNIGYAITQFAKSKGYSVVYEFCGHGVGIKFHEDPEVSHDSDKDTGPILKPGMTFTIEPMINMGKARVVVDRSDKWTARTIDGKLSAQWEHTVLITKTGVEVLTDNKDEYPKPLVLV